MFLNLKGRESQGIVEPGAEAAALKAEIIARLNGLRDAEKDAIAISEAFDTATLYAGPYVGNAPDLLIGYNTGLPRVVGRRDRHRGGSGLRRQHEGVERRSLHRPAPRAGRLLLQQADRDERTRRSSTSRPQRFGCSGSSPPPTWTGGRWLAWHDNRAHPSAGGRRLRRSAHRLVRMQRPAPSAYRPADRRARRSTGWIST